LYKKQITSSFDASLYKFFTNLYRIELQSIQCKKLYKKTFVLARRHVVISVTTKYLVQVNLYTFLE